MNYQHAYHAGSFADVFKHTILVALLMSLCKKPNGFCYIDTHAGDGFYDLFSNASARKQEQALGIEKLIHLKNSPPVLNDYLQVIQRFNQQMTKSRGTSLRYYPGSPVLARYFLRPEDRMVLSELHPNAYQSLKNHFARDRQVSVHLMNGYQGLKAFLPPKERRGLVLIDPPYERPHELNDLLAALPIALKRFINGIYAIWYPIKDRSIIDLFFKNVKKIVHLPLLKTEMIIYPETGAGLLNGSGMLIINPPWQFEQQVAEFLPFLWKTLSHRGQGRYSIESF